jgi:uncharacterized protein YcnI
MNVRAIAVAVAFATALAALAVYGHAVVQPSESIAAQTQQYTLRVPNEKAVPTIAVELLFPAEIQATAVNEQPGWKLDLRRDATGRIVSAAWSGSLLPAADVHFTFSALNPATPVTVEWKVIQTYADALRVEWTGPAGSRTPASRTTIKDVAATN